MAENQIDDLVLDIDVRGVTEKKVKNVNALAKAIDSLNKAVSNISNLEKYLNSLSKLSVSMAKTTSNTATAKATGQGQAKLRKKEVIDTTKTSSGSLNNVQKRIEETTGVLATTYKSASESADAFAQSTALLDESFERISSKTTKLKDGSEELVEVFQRLDKSGKVITKTFKNGLEISTAESAVKKSTASFGKLFASIKRIAVYRMIRTALKEIAQAMREGINNYVQYSDSANSAISNINNSVSQLKNTLGVTLGYLLEALAPAITALTDSLVELINSLNMAIAKSAGKETFDKAAKSADDYAESLKKTNTYLAGFDKFNVIGGEEEESQFEPADIGENWNETADVFADIIDIVKEIWDFLKPIIDELKPFLPMILDIIKMILPEISKIVQKLLPKMSDLLSKALPILADILEMAVDIIDVLIDILSPFIDLFIAQVVYMFDTIKSALMFVRGLLKIITGDFSGGAELIGEAFKNQFEAIKGYLTSLKDFFVNIWKGIANAFAKVVNFIGNSFINLVNWFLDGLNTFLSPISDLIELFGGERINLHWDAVANWQPYPETYANGGIPAVGTMFIAGEAGAEAVYNMSNGRTGVANVAQLQEAFAGALDQRTNVYLDAIYKQMDNQYETNSSLSLTMNDFINAIMPEITKYNQRRGKF